MKWLPKNSKHLPVETNKWEIDTPVRITRVFEGCKRKTAQRSSCAWIIAKIKGGQEEQQKSGGFFFCQIFLLPILWETATRHPALAFVSTSPLHTMFIWMSSGQCQHTRRHHFHHNKEEQSQEGINSSGCNAGYLKLVLVLAAAAAAAGGLLY